MTSAPKLTIGLATYDDYNGVYFSVQALRMYHPEMMQQTEIIIVYLFIRSDYFRKKKEMIRRFV